MKMIFKNINILDENFEIMEGGYLATESGKISYVGEKKPNEKFDREIEGRGKLIIPGFVNSHCHLPMSLLRGYGESMNLQDWLFTKIFPFKWRSYILWYFTIIGRGYKIWNNIHIRYVLFHG